MRTNQRTWLPRSPSILVSIALMTALGIASIAPPVAAEGSATPGMCNGRSDENMLINAHARGGTKYIFNVSTDERGHPSGDLIVGRGKTRLHVDDFCRVWQHIDGLEPGGHGDGHGSCGANLSSGATVVHAVGTGRLDDGSPILVRTDARETDKGMFYRVRYRKMGSHTHEATAHADEQGCSGEDWVSLTAGHGWPSLDFLEVQVVARR